MTGMTAHLAEKCEDPEARWAPNGRWSTADASGPAAGTTRTRELTPIPRVDAR